MRYKPPEPGSVRDLERILDALTREIVLRQESKCFTCPATTNLQCGHLFERRHRGTRWDVAPNGNNHAQCSNCNGLHEEMPYIYIGAYVRRFGQAAYDELDRRAHSNHKLTYSELLEMIEERKRILNDKPE